MFYYLSPDLTLHWPCMVSPPYHAAILYVNHSTGQVPLTGMLQGADCLPRRYTTMLAYRNLIEL